MEVAEVRGRRELAEFIRFPEALYKDDPLWVPPFWPDERKAYHDNNPILRNSEYTLLAARENGRILGRCIPYVDGKFNEYYRSNTGLFGAFECVADHRAMTALIDGIEDWLRDRQVDRIRGPINPVAENWGFLMRGDGRPPIFMTPHTPEYYIDAFEDREYQKVMDLIAYDANADGLYTIPERTRRFLRILAKKRPEITARRFNKTRLMEDAEHIWRLSNLCYADNWGYVPVDRDVMLDMVRRLKPIMDPDAIWFVEDKGVPVGYCLGFPDLNVIIKKISGRVLPFGFIRLLSGKKKLKEYRLFGLAVHPDYQGMGLDVLLYVNLFDVLKPREIRLEANYILEDNLNIRNALEKLGMREIRSYRIFEKEI
jgi:GNAT superfamily N-acetyltransferase